MRSGANIRRVASWLGHLFALLVLAACATPSHNTVLIRERGNARLGTRLTEGLFLTTVRLGEREVGPFLIDTGATKIVLDSELAKTVQLSSWIEVDHPDFKQKVAAGILASLEVGPLSFQNTDVVVMDLSPPTTLLGERLAGLLGQPFFAHAVVEVDYPAQSITCFDPRTYRLPRGEWLPLTVQAGRPIMGARLDGNVTGQFLLDTGSNFAVLFYPAFVQHHALLDHRETTTQTIVQMDGAHDTLRATIAWFEFAGRRFEQPLVNFAPADLPMPLPAGLAGVIGHDVLRHFTIVFNYPAAKIALLPK